MSSSTLTASTNGKSLQVKYRRADKVTTTALAKIVEKLSMTDQVDVRRFWMEVPRALLANWRDIYKCLDFEVFQRQLANDALKPFLRKMRRHFRSVCFSCDKLQEQLNLLDRSGISELPGVRDCDIRWDQNTGDDYAKWPLRSLSKLIPHLNRLQLHMPVKLGLIEFELFDQLRELALYEDVHPEAMIPILDRCERLKTLNILCKNCPNLMGISKCGKLQELTLPVSAFNESSALEIFQLPQLKFLELQQKEESAKKTIEAMQLTLDHRSNETTIMQINGAGLGDAQWLLDLRPQRCSRLDGLMLVDCQFGSLDLSFMDYIPVLTYVAFCQCADLTDKLVVDFVKACPVLTQLYLIGCPALTIELLYSLFNMRCVEKLGVPALGIYLQDGDILKEEYKQNFVKQSTLELLETPLDDNRMEHMQFVFLHDETQQ